MGWWYVAVYWAVHHPPDAKEAALLHLVWLWKMLLAPPFTSLNISWDGVHTLSNNNVMLSSRHFLQTLWFCEPRASSEPWQGRTHALSACFMRCFSDRLDSPLLCWCFEAGKCINNAQCFSELQYLPQATATFFFFWHHQGESKTQLWRHNIKRERDRRKGQKKAEEYRMINVQMNGHKGRQRHAHALNQ